MESKTTPNVFYVGIIGSAGRTAQQQSEWSLETYNKTFLLILDILKNQYKILSGSQTHKIVLVSGGSSWGDHLALKLFLDQKPLNKNMGLKIYLPCKLNQKEFDPTSCCGKRLNVLHQQFGKKINQNTFLDFHIAKQLGATLHQSQKDNFFARNQQIAERCTHLIGVFGSNKDGGTMYTWNRARAKTKTKIFLNPPKNQSRKRKFFSN
jgi:hypothetical protein